MPRHGITASGTAEPTASTSTGRGFGLSSWPIRRKLVALVIGPLLVILGGGVVVTVQAYNELQQAQDVQSVTASSLATSRVSEALQSELVSTLNLGVNPAPGTAIKLVADRKATDAAYAALSAALADAPHGGWDPTTRLRANSVLLGRQQLSALRERVYPHLSPSAFKTDRSPTAGLDRPSLELEYSGVYQPPRLLSQRLAQRLAGVTSDGRTVNSASTIETLGRAAGVAADEIIDVSNALTNGMAPPSGRRSLSDSSLQQQELLALAQTHATDRQSADINSIKASDEWIDDFRKEADKALAANDPNAPSTTAQAGDPTNATQTDAGSSGIQRATLWISAAGQRLANLNGLADSAIQEARDQAAADQHDALVRLGLVAGGVLLLLVFVTGFSVVVARSVSVPMRRLRSAAVETANVRLPAAVAQIDREGPDAQVDMPPALPPGEGGGPETTEVARAFDGLTGEAVRLASAQVRLRRSLDDAFVSMSRRSQSMVEKQLAIIDELERTEEDPDQLRNLFRLDHLAARMRRYNDNLLVLAGSVVRTRTNAPVPIADVFRAATSEMEQYERVRLQPVNGAAVAGPAAGGLIHLLAELLDNAAMYSPPTSPILMAAALEPDGALRLEITDSGVGIPGSELDELNSRLADPGTFDMQVPSRMGLYVVGRLAQRGGFAVRLAQRDGAAGTVAEVVVPAQLVMGAAGLAGPPIGVPNGQAQEPATPSAPAAAAAREPLTPARPTPAVPVASSSPASPLSPVPPAPGTPGDGAPEGEQPAPATPEPVGVARAADAAVPAPDDDPERTTTTRIRTPSGVTPTTLPRRTPGPVPAGEATGETPARSGSPLPSRRPGAALAGGPLASVAAGGSPFAAPPVPPAAAVTPAPFDEPGEPAQTAPAAPAASVAAEAGPAATPAGAPSVTGRTGGGFGAPGRPFTAGTPGSTRRPAGAGAPSAATAAAAAAAARAARAGGSAPNAASALFAPTGPATDGAGTIPAVPSAAPPTGPATPPPPVSSEGPDGPDQSEAPATPSEPLPVASDTGEQPAATPARDPAPAVGAGRGNGTSDGSSHRDADDGAQAVPAPAEPLSREVPLPAEPAGTPIFDTVSMWFTADGSPAGPDRVIDLRDAPADRRAPVSAARWSALGDQRWLATNARAAAGPEVSGTTQVGLPRRRPGANLIPSAAAAAPVTTPAAGPEVRARRAPTGSRADLPGRADADAVRGRLSSYQRGLTSARRARHLPADRSADGLFATSRSGENDPGRSPGEQGG